MMTNQKKCLLMCATPLQTLIASKIIEQNPYKRYDLILIKNPTDNNSKFEYYFNNLKDMCHKSEIWISYPGLQDLINFKKFIKSSSINIDYDELYLANIQRTCFIYLVSKNSNAKLYTFDDGLANIVRNSKFYDKPKSNYLKKLVWRFLGIKYSMQDIKHKSLTHFTIYPNKPNIISKVKNIDLFPIQSTTDIDSTSEVISIFIGQPLLQINQVYTNEFINRVLDKLNITLYFPHPIESNINNIDAEIIQTNLILEDYVLKKIQSEPNIRIKLYSFFSGALINMSQVERVELNYLYDKFLFEKYEDFYMMAKKDFNIALTKI